MKKGDCVKCVKSYVTYITTGKSYEILAAEGDEDLDEDFKGCHLSKNALQIESDDGEITFVGYPSCLVGEWELVK